MIFPEDVVQYRVRRAREALTEANVMADLNHWNACVNRLYYACFYATSALLAAHGLSASKHTGVRSTLHSHFVRTGEISADLGRFYNDIFESRQDGDYDDFALFEESDVRPMIEGADNFVDQIQQLLRRRGDTRK